MADVVVERIEGAEIEGDKRQCAPFVLRWTCKCGAACERDLTDHYLSEPIFGRVEQHFLHCITCETDVGVCLRLSMTLEVVPSAEGEASRG